MGNVHLELLREAFETAGACDSKRGGAGECPEQQFQASRAGVAPQRKIMHTAFEEKSNIAVTPLQVIEFVY